MADNNLNINLDSLSERESKKTSTSTNVADKYGVELFEERTKQTNYLAYKDDLFTKEKAVEEDKTEKLFSEAIVYSSSSNDTAIYNNIVNIFFFIVILEIVVIFYKIIRKRFKKNVESNFEME